MLVLVLHLVGFSSSKRCDTYVFGNVWIHNFIDEGPFSFEGCKKGCFFNQTYAADGVKKCEKCSTITNESLCVDNIATCQWANGKCKSTSCPKIAKARDINSFDNTADVGRGRDYKECVEGSVKEQFFNKQYLDDYMANFNTTDGPNSQLYPPYRQCDDTHQYVVNQITSCKILPATFKQLCEKNATDGQPTGGAPVVSRFDDCLLDAQGEINAIGQANFTSLYYYTSAESWCRNNQTMALQNCTAQYESRLASCYNRYGRGQGDMVRDHASTKAARTACHKVYGCMYSEDNQRCSVWAVWAFVVVLVLMILIAVCAIVALLMVFCKDKLSKGTTLFSGSHA